MELIGSVGGMRFVNDSKATNADAAAKALTSWGEGLHWVLGGQPKDGGIDSLAPFFKNVARAYLIGEAGPAFEKVLKAAGVSTILCGTMERAVLALGEVATEGGTGTALLSPACASFDQFKDFEDRGRAFRQCCEALPGFVPYGGKPRA